MYDKRKKNKIQVTSDGAIKTEGWGAKYSSNDTYSGLKRAKEGSGFVALPPRWRYCKQATKNNPGEQEPNKCGTRYNLPLAANDDGAQHGGERDRKRRDSLHQLELFVHNALVDARACVLRQVQIRTRRRVEAVSRPMRSLFVWLGALCVSLEVVWGVAGGRHPADALRLRALDEGQR